MRPVKTLPLLKEQGIEATLVDLYSLPFDDVAILELAQRKITARYSR